VSWLGQVIGLMNRRAVASILSVSMVSTLVVVAAVQSDGAKATNVRLDDGSVWVTNEQRVGRLNVRIRELDFATSAARGGDVVQDGRSVVYSGPAGGVQQLDVFSGASRGSNEAKMSDYQVRGGISALHDIDEGRLWVGRDIDLVGADYPEKPDVLLEQGSLVVLGAEAPDPEAARPEPGALLVVDSTGWWKLELDENRRPVREEDETDEGENQGDETTTTSTTSTTVPAPGDSIPEPLPDPILLPVPQPLPVLFADVAAVTAVGEIPVLLTVAGEVAGVNGVAVKIPGDEHVLQQPGYESDVALVSSTAGLFAVDLESGELTQLGGAADASPAAPVRVGPCVFAAWSGSAPTYFKQCGDDVLQDGVEIPGAAADVELVWRVNQNNVALNSPGDGGVWADHEGSLSFAGNWSDVEPDSEDEEQEDATGESERIVEKICIDGFAQAPTAGDDELGVRPRQSIIAVLNNDDDVNCEPIAITQVTPTGGPWGQLTIIDNGQHILYSPSDEWMTLATEALQVFQFDYVVADSAGNSSEAASVTVSVKDNGVGNVAPALRPKSDDTTRTMRTIVEAGRGVSHNVLVDWWDADGDDLRLVSAVALDVGEVSATPDGVVNFQANGVSAGVYQVDVTMSDGLLTTVEKLEVTVKPTGSPIPPVVEDDFLTIVEGQSATVSPLANDSDPNEDRLALLPLWLPDAEGSYRTALQNDEVTITGLAPGTYALPYEATDGNESTRGYIWLRVRALSEANTGPVGVPDQVKIRAARVINVDVLANDIDLDGDILAVTDVRVNDGPPELGEVRATIVDRRLVQLEVVPGPDGTPPTGPFTVRYTLDDGRAQERLATQTPEEEIAERQRATGAVTVVVQPAAEDQPPRLEPDQATVRSGDITRVAVLRNDIDPDSDEITLESVDQEQAAQLDSDGAGVAWVQGRYVYFKGGTPGSYRLFYNARAGNKTGTAEVAFQVTPAPDPATNPNQAPAPKDLVVRAIRNGEVRVPVALFGADADGDSVTLLGEFNGLQGSEQGNRVRLDPENPGVMLFAAGATSPATDSFSYTVKDKFGFVGSADVRVMVLDDTGLPPQGHDDVFIGKPGRTLSIPALGNDTSPQDRQLELDVEPFFDLDGQPTTEPLNGESVTLLDQQDKDTRGRINVEVPLDGSTINEHYRITDGFSPGDAYIRVSGDPDVPNAPPVAVTDEVPLEETRDVDVAMIDVLLNDYDPDDAGGGLALEIPVSQSLTPDGDEITVDGSMLSIPLTELSQTVLYRITDADGGEAVGFVRVPGKQNQPPILSPAGEDISSRVIVAGSTEPLSIALATIVEDPDGDTPIKLTPTEVKLLGTLGTVERTDGNDGFVFTPPADLQESATVVIQFEVTDRPDKTADERALPNCNCLAQLEVALLIEASSPPRILSPGAISVPQLDEEVSYNLAPLSVDDQGDSLTYELDSSSFGGLDVSLSGSQVTLVSKLAEESKIPLGSTIPIRYTVTDGNFDPVGSTVNVTMIATNKGQPATGSFPELQAERDVSIATPNFIDAASNPFPDRPLTLLNPSADGGAEITCSDAGACQFLSNTVGTFTVSYTVKDAVGQTANGTMTVVVKGMPRAPGVPSIESVGDHVVNLSWTAADMQGGEFSTYKVTAVEAGVTKDFANTGGEFDGLTNGTAYTFTVFAVNELGDGEVSNPSSPGIPDRVPDPPVNARITNYADGALTLEWEPPLTADDFTPIRQYEISIGGQTVLVDGSTTSATIGVGGLGSELINGTNYGFRVRAQNSATVDNGWGAFGTVSAPEKPSRYPDQPTGVLATNSGDGGTPRLTVTWSPPGFDGGRAIQQYRVCQVQSPSNCQTTPSRQATFDLPRNQDVSFAVIAINSDKNRPESDPSAASPLVRTVGNPDTPTISIQSSGDKTLTAIASTTNNSGCSQLSIEYSRDGGTSWQGSGTFNTGLTNGTRYTVVARATLASSCGTAGTTYRSGVSNGAPATPYGPLQQPMINVQSSGTQMRTTWNANRSDDERPTWSVSLSGNAPGCSGSAQTGDSGWVEVGPSATRTCTITVSASDVSSKSDEGQATTDPAPPPPLLRSISTSEGAPATTAGTCTAPACRYVNVSGSNFTPGASLQVLCGGSPTWYNFQATPDGNGNFGVTQATCRHEPGEPQSITVRDDTGQASQTSTF